MIDNQYQLANNPETAPEILRELSQSDDRAIRQAVAGNPNVPIALLWELLADFPHQIIANPVFSLIEMTNPDWVLDIPEPNLVALLKHQNIPHIFIKESRKCKAMNVVDAVLAWMASNPATTTEQLEEITLFYDGIETWPFRHPNLHWVIWHPNIQIESLKKFAVRCNDILKLNLAGYCLDERYQLPKHLSRQDLIDEVLPVLINHALNEGIMHFILLNKSLPQKYIQPILAKLSLSGQISLVKFSLVSGAILKQIYDMHLIQLQQLSNQSGYGTNDKIRLSQALVRNSQTPDHIIQQFSNSPYKAIRAQVARQIALSPELFIKLAQDTYPRTKLSLLANRKIRFDLLAELTKHPNPQVSQLAKQHPNTPKSAR
jgi:hypothetical protein